MAEPEKIPEEAKALFARLKETAGSSGLLRVMIYGNPDPDALASSMALKSVLEEATAGKLAVVLNYTGAVGRPENASMIRQLKIPVTPISEAEAKDADRIAIVDGQPQFFQDFTLPRCDIVIDHHPMLLDRTVPFEDIRPEYLSTSSIMTEYMRAAGTRLTRGIASALLYGIKTDSRNFMADLSTGDIEALRWLRKKSDRDIVKRIEFSQFSRDALDYFSIALVRRRFVQGVMFAHLGPVPSYDVCVQIADFLIRVEHVEWALVTGIVATELVVVFRNDGVKKDAGYLARTAFGKVGSAGGHKSMGRASIPQKNLPNGLLVTDNKGIEKFVLTQLSKVDPVFAPVLKTI
ncbi:MAG: DHH family phosphoesterase [Nitrospirota bacterium]